MKHIGIFALICISLCLFSCDEILDLFPNNDNPQSPSDTKAPVISIENVADVTSSSAVLTAILSSVGTSKVTQMGFCWSSTNQVPTLSDKYSNQGDTEVPRSFNATITGLEPSTMYYCCAYARNSAGVVYSPVMTFTTTNEYVNPNAEVGSVEVAEITSDSAMLTSGISSIGTSKVTQMGFCWSSSNPDPTLSDEYSNLGETEVPRSFSATITGLEPSTTYYCRAYARNSAGVSYGSAKAFATTEYVNPNAVISISEITDVTSESATLKAILSSVGTSKVTQMGFCWSSSNKTPTLSDKVSKQGASDVPCSISATVDKLSSETTYYCRAYATNAAGTSYSDVLSFTTLVSYKVMAAYSFDKSNCEDYYNHNNGVGIGEVSFISDTPSGNGKSVFINGMKGGFINIPYNPFVGLTEYSISLWLKDFSSGALLYGLATNGSQSSDFPRILILDSGYFQFKTIHYSNSVAFVYPYTSIQSSAWHHLVFTCSRKTSNTSMATLSLYVDGKLVDNSESDFSTYYDSYGITKIVIGGDRGGAYSSATMKLDELVIFGEALAASQVKRLFDGKGATTFD